MQLKARQSEALAKQGMAFVEDRQDEFGRKASQVEDRRKIAKQAGAKGRQIKERDEASQGKARDETRQIRASDEARQGDGRCVLRKGNARQGDGQGKSKRGKA
jgi:hypothetical protein